MSLRDVIRYFMPVHFVQNSVIVIFNLSNKHFTDSSNIAVIFTIDHFANCICFVLVSVQLTNSQINE